MGESSPAAVHTVASPGLFRYSILLFDIVACSAGLQPQPDGGRKEAPGWAYRPTVWLYVGCRTVTEQGE